MIDKTFKFEIHDHLGINILYAWRRPSNRIGAPTFAAYWNGSHLILSPDLKANLYKREPLDAFRLQEENGSRRITITKTNRENEVTFAVREVK